MDKKGFTLVELLMVVIIIGILVTLAVPNYYRSIERAKAGKAKAAMDAIRKAEIQYRAFNDEYIDLNGDMAELEPYDLPADIVDDANDSDWTYSVDGSGEDAMLIHAERDDGPNATEELTMDQDGVMANPGAIPEWGVN
ncbi:MAG: type II secretion system protein [Candidatus Omnitrophica bacterium]|nr:type II secretion system protein [Candidatus Omnitrophota bacterium]